MQDKNVIKLTDQDAALLEQGASMLEGLENDERNRGNCSTAEGAGCSAHAVRRLASALLAHEREIGQCLHQIQEPAKNKLLEAKPAFYTAIAEHDGDWIPLPEYSAQTSDGVLQRVLARAREEGYQGGNALERLKELGWAYRPVYFAVDPAQVAPLPLLIRDIALDLGITCAEACLALKPLGNFSTNTAVTAEMMAKLRECFPERVPASEVAGARERMTAGRACYFMERFLKEEKLLGPNEQAVLHYVIDMLEAAAAPVALPEPDFWVRPGATIHPDRGWQCWSNDGTATGAFHADTVRALLATATGLPAQAGVNRYCSAGMCVSSDKQHDPKCTAAPQAQAVELDDSALLDAMEQKRIAVVPEYEGPWDAEVYNDEGKPNHRGTGSTPREAIRAAIAAAKGESQ